MPKNNIYSLSSLKDYQLLKLMRDDNDLAYNCIYNRYWKRLLIYTANILNDQSMAEDVLQDVFTKLWLNRHEVKIDILESYLFVAVKHQSISLFRKVKFTALNEEIIENLLPHNIEADSHIITNELEASIFKSIKKLPKRCRDIFSGASIKYPVNFYQKKYREVAITGEAYLEVVEDSLQPFIVNLGEVSVKVLGTKFNIETYENNQIYEVVLAEGSIGLYTNKEKLNKNPTLMLSPGYKAEYNKLNKNFSKQKVNIQAYIAWKDGEFIYQNMPFGQILKKLERHFDVSISCENKTLSEELFNANFGKNPSLNQVLEDFEVNYGIDYKIEDINIIIK